MQKLSFTEKFIHHITEHQLFKASDTVLLAVSGGMDSVTMLSLFRQCGFIFEIAHCNFQLRGKESEADETFVRNLADTYKVPCHVKRFDTFPYQKLKKLSPEEAARNLRYSWFEELLNTGHYQVLATAHHAQDVVETVLLNLTRGTGIKGVTGIPVKNGRVIRPLLFATKQEIEQYCTANTLSYRVDETNKSDTFSRNKIRNHIIPVLKTMNPSLETTITNNVQHFTDALEIYASAIKNLKKQLIDVRGDAVFINKNKLMHAPSPRTVLFELITDFGFNTEQAASIYKACNAVGSCFQSPTHKLMIDRGYFIIRKLDNATSVYIIIEQKTKKVVTSYFTLSFSYSNYKPGMQFKTDGTIAYFDAEKIQFPLLLRTWKKGDYFYPFGMYKKGTDQQPAKPAKKKVSNMLIDLKISTYEKEHTCVLLAGERIAWLAGHRQDERFRLTSSTKKLLKIKMLPVKRSI
jgi:tRNA(Ile)-lysidine synthase